MTTPTIDSSLSGQTTGTIKVPDYSTVLQAIADTLSSQPVDTKLIVGTLTTNTLTTLVATTGVRAGFFVIGEGVPDGTFITQLIAGTPNVLLLSNDTTPPADPTGTYTLVSPAVAQAHTLGKLANVLNSTGVKAYDPYTLVGKAESYAFYGESPADLDKLIANLPKVPNSKLDQIKALLAPATKL